MHISYNKLWKLLIDKGMNKQKLREVSGISSTPLPNWAKERTSQLRCYCGFVRH